jgi:hypothetical protein
VGDGPRVAKHVYTLVDLIGTPAPRVTVEDLVVRKAEEATFHEDPRHRHAPMLVNGPWLDYGHVVGVCIPGLFPHVQTMLVRAVIGNVHHTPRAGCGVGLSGERVGWFVHASCCRYFVLVGRESRARYVMNLCGHELCGGGRCRSAVATTFPCPTFCLLAGVEGGCGWCALHGHHGPTTRRRGPHRSSLHPRRAQGARTLAGPVLPPPVGVGRQRLRTAGRGHHW